MKMTPKHGCILLDACVVMNLYASGHMEAIIASISEALAVAVYVIEFEALTVYTESKKNRPNEKEEIQLQPFIEKGLLQIADLESDAERATFLSFSAQRLDDGEAITMAIASHRNWAVATDDRLAIRIFSSQNNHIQIISTPEIMKHWQENGRPDAHTFSQAMTDIEARANFLLGKGHPLYEWWQKSKNG